MGKKSLIKQYGIKALVALIIAGLATINIVDIDYTVVEKLVSTIVDGVVND